MAITPSLDGHLVVTRERKRRKEFQKQGAAGERPCAGKRETGERAGGQWGVRVPQRLPQMQGCKRTRDPSWEEP